MASKAISVGNCKFLLLQVKVGKTRTNIRGQGQTAAKRQTKTKGTLKFRPVSLCGRDQNGHLMISRIVVRAS